MALTRADRRAFSVVRPSRFLPLLRPLSLALALLPLVAQGQPLDSLIVAALSSDPATQSVQSQQASARAGVAERRAELSPELSPEVYLRAECQYGKDAIRNAVPENPLFLGLSTCLGAGLSTLTKVELQASQMVMTWRLALNTLGLEAVTRVRS